MRFIQIFAAILALVAVCHADDAVVPDIVARGFDTYQKFGLLPAVDAWLKGSPFAAGDKDLVTEKIKRVESSYGAVAGYELLRIVKLTPSTQRVYLAVKYEKGVAWMFFDCYRPTTEWIVASFDFSTKADEIVPTSILGGH
ncbi:MAG: hypothetical protein WCD79_02140 [Chthoniobacteraceae bacterium]